MINEFILDTSRIQQQTNTIQKNDVSACYDRIITYHALFNSRRDGTPKRVYKLRSNPLQFSRYHIQTSLCTLKGSYSHNYHPIYGAGQENGFTDNK